MDRVTKLLRELIALPSVNPAFLPAQDPRTGERQIAEFLAACAASLGLDVELPEALPNRPNVVIRLSPQRKVRHRILLAPHLDTVACEAEPDTLFTPRQKNGRLYGRGACDTKSSVAAMLAALSGLALSAARPATTEIVMAGLVDEENAQAGSRALVASGIRADLAIIGEPTGLQVVTAHKGILWLRLETTGQSAHGARPELGRNAVHAMARLVDILATQYAAGLQRRHHRLLGAPTINIGVITGGAQPNIVPARCAITVDRRTLPGETEASVRREIKAMLRRSRLAATITNVKSFPCPPLETNARLPWVRQFLRCAGQIQPAGADFFCDAAVLAGGGIPSIVFGPGDIAQAHTASEWVSLRAVARGTHLLLRFLQSLP